jgi:hypothetical protein
MTAKKAKGKAKAPANEPNATTDTNTDALMREMEGDHPEAFRFTEGDMIVGKVVRFGTGYSEYGPHPIVIIADESDGEHRAVHCMQTVLRNQMTEADPVIGDRVAVKCLGTAKNKAGNRKYTDFRVRVDMGASEGREARSFSDVASRIEDRMPDHDVTGEDDLPF